MVWILRASDWILRALEWILRASEWIRTHLGGRGVGVHVRVQVLEGISLRARADEYYPWL